MIIQVYGKPDCPFCDRAKNLLGNKKFSFEYFELGTDFDRSFIREAFPMMKTFPIITVNNKVIGGYTELVEAAAEPNFGMTLLQG